MTESLIAAGSSGASTPAAADRLSPGAWSWILFECGRVPQVLLISSIVFVPYFARVVTGNPVQGQSLIASMHAWIGLVAAVTAPLLGATVDRWGPRKPWLAFTVTVLAALLFSLWWAKPDASALSVTAILVILAAYSMIGGYTDLVFNSMMPVAVGRRQAAKASGYALAAANVVGVLALVLVLWAFELPGKIDLSFIPKHPLFGLDAAQYEPARIVGPIAAVCVLLFSWPLFLFAPDAPRSGLSIPAAARAGFGDLIALVRQARGAQRNLATYLLARITYGDAVGAYIAFSGLYAAGVMGFRGYEMLVLGILGTFFCGLGAFIAQLLDRTIGPRRALMLEVAALAIFILGEIGMAPNRILYMAYDRAAHGPVWSGPMFTHAPDLTYIVLALGAAMTLVASAASGRTLLVRLTPPAQMGAMFGLAALTGSATNWLAPLLIKIFTDTWRTQQAGFVPILLLLGVGLTCMLFVRGGGPVVVDSELSPPVA